MDYKVDINSNDVSTTHDVETDNKRWDIKDIYASDFTVDSLVDTLKVIDIFKKKYPNDETIQDFEDIVRDEICQMFGGTILNELL